MLARLAAAAALLALSTTARAADPYMWGVGPRLGTIVVPGAFPPAFPDKIRRYDMDGDGNTDVDANGDPIETSLTRSRWEAILGAEGVYYLDKQDRLGGLTAFTLGNRFWMLDLIAKYDRVLAPGSIDLIGGLGVGVGLMHFGGSVGEERLSVPYYPLRAHLLGQLRDGTRAYQLGVALQYDLPSNHYYVDQAGDQVDVKAPVNYWQLNVEITVMFGDFEPPKPKGRKHGGGRRKH